MRADYTLVLAAGFGTRMGEIGKKIPKPLWPVFERKLIDLQLNLAMKLTKKKIFVNIHYMHDEISAYLEQNYGSRVSVLHEEKILDVGGAIHNVAIQSDVNYNGTLLVLNADLYLALSENEITSALQNPSWTTWLWLEKVDCENRYNQVVLSDDRVIGIKKYDQLTMKKTYETYTGVSMVRLDRLKRIQGPSPFFDSVANWKEATVLGKTIEGIQYLDFGTLDRYIESMWFLLNKKIEGSHTVDSFDEMEIFDHEKISNKCKSYGPGSGNSFINLTEEVGKIPNGLIWLKSNAEKLVATSSVVYEDIVVAY